jgi:hypothetical protein
VSGEYIIHTQKYKSYNPAGYSTTRVCLDDPIPPHQTLPHNPPYFSSAHSLSCTDISSSWSLVIGLIVIVAASVAAWFLSPKGENQT